MKFARTLFTLSASIALAGCHASTKPLQNPSPLVVASCPDLTPLVDDSFGATASKLVEVAGIYYQCRSAAGVP